MQAFAYQRHGGVPSVLSVSLPPSPGPTELLVKVFSASLNPADFKSAAGEQAALLSFSWPRVYGFDFAGTVSSVGSDVKGFAPGDRVFGMIRGLPMLHAGTVAEYCLVPSDVAAKMPPTCTYAQCASLPLVAITAVLAFESMGAPRLAAPPPGSSSSSSSSSAVVSGRSPHPRVLVLGGAGGVGTAALQLARCAFGASFVATTASKGPKTDLCKRLGADVVVDYRDDKFEEALRPSKFGGDDDNDDDPNLFDYVLDTTGEVWRARNLVRRGGGVCSIIAHPTVEGIRIWLASSRLPAGSTTLGVQPFLNSSWGGWLLNCVTGARAMKAACEARGATYTSVIGTGNGDIVGDVARWMHEGKLVAVIDQEYDMKDSSKALEKLQSGRVAGKVIINVQSDDSGNKKDGGKI